MSRAYSSMRTFLSDRPPTFDERLRNKGFGLPGFAQHLVHFVLMREFLGDHVAGVFLDAHVLVRSAPNLRRAITQQRVRSARVCATSCSLRPDARGPWRPCRGRIPRCARSCPIGPQPSTSDYATKGSVCPGLRNILFTSS